MKIASLTSITPVISQLNNSNKLKEKNTIQVTENQYQILPSFAYQDYNVSFSGRTPEDFYAQDFNRNNMPQTMKDYLYYDYENRQHIPPEQMMKEVFKYIEISDNFLDVKSIYPHEDLFSNLHENNVKSRKGILSEISIAKELSDAPLLNNGSDDFGMYLLRKIYLEGKTLKQINKDFFEKDINDEYKGFITEPIKYSTLSAYGIDYPNTAFWISFINTRDEYKKFFVTLPKNSNVPGVNIPSKVNSSIQNAKKCDNVEKTPKRRFHIKKYRKNEIERDLINKKCPDEDSVKKTVVKRFGKDDPEASFIVRYMSPIMTVAADRAHMSQELRSFAEYEQANGKQANGKTMFERFWKHNPKMLDIFSAGVTDSIDMFEDIYGEGGLIPINTDLERITKTSKNQKIIDFVSPEFLELLTYAQQIEPKRNELYAKHDELQKQWEQHFIDRYGDLTTIPDTEPEISEAILNPDQELSFEERLQKEADKNNAGVYKLKTIDGNYVYLTSNIDEVLEDEIKSYAKYLPSKYAARYIRETKKEDFSDEFKLTLATKKIMQELGDDQIVPDDERLMSDNEYNNAYYDIVKYHYINYKDERAARMAILDSLVKDKSIFVKDAGIYNTLAYNINEGNIDVLEEDINQFKSIIKNCKKNIDSMFNYYIVPPTNSEANKIELQMLDMLSKYNSDKSILEDKSSIELISMLKEILPNERNKESLKLFLGYLIKENPYSKSLLQKGISDECKNAKFEIIMDDFIHILMASAEKMPNVITIFNNEVYNRHKSNLSSEIQGIFTLALNKMNYDGKIAFFSSNNIIKPIDKFGLRFKLED